jgi:hypothetical protein
MIWVSKLNKKLMICFAFFALMPFPTFALTATSSAANALAPATLNDINAKLYDPSASLTNPPTAGIANVDPNCLSDAVKQANQKLDEDAKKNAEIAAKAKAERDRLLACLGGMSLSGTLGFPSLAGLLDAACAAARKALSPIVSSATSQLSNSVVLPGGVKLGSTASGGGNPLAGPTLTAGSTGSVAGFIK